MVYTVRLASHRGGRTALEHELRRRGITQKNSRPSHPTTCGKVCEDCSLVLHRSGLTQVKV
jgi:hypothetical protein